MNAIVKQWIDQGMPVNNNGVPHEVKVHIIQTYGERYGLDTFVETGTCHGAMVEAVAGQFSSIHTVEMYPPNYEASKKRLAPHKNIKCYFGDSAEVLSDICLNSIRKPTLFFLDAHYSGGGTARGAVDTPIVRELEILAPAPYDNVIIIDDARLFEGERFHTDDFKDYPSFEWISKFVEDNFEVPSKVYRDADEYVIAPRG